MTLFTWGMVGLLIVGLAGSKFSNASFEILWQIAICTSALGFLARGVIFFIKKDPMLGAVFIGISLVIFLFLYTMNLPHP